ncbi:MAG: PilZ domain-containing protein, partial [Candidatus Methylomirabilaceae bacterium]
TLVSLGGCAIETDTKLSSGQILQLQLKPSDRDPAVAVDAAVVRGIRSPLVGLQFLRFRMEERERLSQFVRGFRATHQ